MTKHIIHDKPVLRRTLETIKGYLESKKLFAGNKIPSVRALCQETGVSYVTMCKTLQMLRRKGILTLINKRSYIISKDFDTKKANEKVVDLKESIYSKRPWQKVAEKISQEIHNGVYRAGVPLPSIKELQHRYGVAYQTIKKALAFLLAEKTLIQLDGGGYTNPLFTSEIYRSKIICILGSPDSHTAIFGQNDEALFRSIEELCVQARIKIDIYLQFNTRDHYQFRQLSSGKILEMEDLATLADSSVLGFTYFIIWPPGDEDERTIKTILANKRPFVILDETNLLNLSSEIIHSKYLRIYNVAISSDPAVDIANYLFSINHKKIAFISADHQYAWSKQRLVGLTASYTQAGHSDGVTEFTLETPDLLTAANKRSELKELIKFHTHWQKRLPESYQIEFNKALNDLTWIYYKKAEQRNLLYGLFEKALLCSNITAWVLVNDSTATVALDFLVSKGMKIPQDLSIISFDDSPEALRSNYSSYNFNTQAIATAMIGFILGRAPYAQSALPPKGFIVHRGSTVKLFVKQKLPH